MEDPLFDAIFALCMAAEEDGFTAVADALELVLDVYLLEREQIRPAEPIFLSRRAAALRDIEAFEADKAADRAEPETPPANTGGWSMSYFPLAQVARV